MTISGVTQHSCGEDEVHIQQMDLINPTSLYICTNVIIKSHTQSLVFIVKPSSGFNVSGLNRFKIILFSFVNCLQHQGIQGY